MPSPSVLPDVLTPDEEREMSEREAWRMFCDGATTGVAFAGCVMALLFPSREAPLMVLILLVCSRIVAALGEYLIYRA